MKVLQDSIAGSAYFLRGARLMLAPDLRLFVIVPFVINLLIFSVLTYFALSEFSTLLAVFMAELPEWLVVIAQWVLSLLLGVLLLLVFGYSFTLLANLIAAPFNGILAERVELKLTGQTPPAENLLLMCLRTLGRELRKWCYFLPRALGIFLLTVVLFFIPGVNFLIPVIGFIWGAWCMAIQYVDYPLDNHQKPFAELRRHVASHKAKSMGFGSVVMLVASVPVINFVVMPVAVVAATILAVENRMLSEGSVD